MRPRKPKTRRAWLITWESSRPDYLKDLDRPRVVAILKPQLGSDFIRRLLPILYTTESKLTFREKIGWSFERIQPGWLRNELQCICYGGNPWLNARRVEDLYVQCYESTLDRETLHWTESAQYGIDRATRRPVEVVPARSGSEDVQFDILWNGESLPAEDARARRRQRNPGRRGQRSRGLVRSLVQVTPRSPCKPDRTGAAQDSPQR